MMATNRDWRVADRDLDDLRKMIGLDKHRPGPARARLLAEQVPVWAIVGYAKAVASATSSPVVSDDVIAQVAMDYDVSPMAVRAALLYYEEHREAIDALLEANAAAIG